MKWITLSFLFLLLTACRPEPPAPSPRPSGAGQALDWWAFLRSYPEGRLYSSRLYRARQQQREAAVFRDELPAWSPLGPRNIGGRTLCLAFHPRDPNILFAGSAGGGLWKTTTAGRGPDAWTYVPTGFPVLAVAAIAIDPADPQIMYIGAGEVYNYTAAQPGIADRFTRGTYGLGILQSTDGGRSWRPSLDWSLTELRGVWDIVINPANPRTVYAATTEGLFVSHDRGRSWLNSHPLPMAMDLELSPADTAVLYVSHGSLNSPRRGIYRSRDGGRTFSQLPGLPDDYTGKTTLAVSTSDAQVLYASVADETAGRGLYRSADGGDTWDLVNGQDVPRWQGWYAHEIAVDPRDPDALFYAGIDLHASTDAGRTLRQVTYWSKWDLGAAPPPEGPDGPPDYIHADIHGVYYQPGNPDAIFAATDGGIFVSENGGASWASRNGGYQTSQFYASFASSPTDPGRAIGGLQDNATVLYTGSPNWIRHIGGDGTSAAIHPVDERVLFASSQFLALRRSDDGGHTFQPLIIESARGERRAFSAPYELSAGHPDVVFAGAERLHVSYDRGQSWRATTPGPVDGGNPILTLAVHPTNDQEIIIATAPLVQGPARVLRSADGGRSWTPATGLPNRLATDIDYHPSHSDTLYITFAGFGTPHLYRSVDGGISWAPLDAGLPDVPANAVLVDPLNSDHLYLGNDLGVYASFDGGRSWRPHAIGLPDAALVMDLSLSPANRRLRAATHGHGVFEADLLPPGQDPEPPGDGVSLQIFPNPFHGDFSVDLHTGEPLLYSLFLYNAQGQRVATLEVNRHVLRSHRESFDLSGLAAGVYVYHLRGRMERSGAAVSRRGKLVKR